MTDEERVASIKADMVRHRKDVRDQVSAYLGSVGKATTSELRSQFPKFRQKHLASVFWNRLLELEETGVIVRAGSQRVQTWEFPSTVWSLKP